MAASITSGTTCPSAVASAAPPPPARARVNHTKCAHRRRVRSASSAPWRHTAACLPGMGGECIPRLGRFRRVEQAAGAPGPTRRSRRVPPGTAGRPSGPRGRRGGGPPSAPRAHPSLDRVCLSIKIRTLFWAISEFPKWRKYLISLSFRDKSSVRPVQVGGFEANIVVHRSTAVRGRGGPPPPWESSCRTRTGPVEADGTVDAQNAPTAPWKTLRVFHELPQGLSHRITHAKPRKAPKWRWETRIDPYSDASMPHP